MHDIAIQRSALKRISQVHPDWLPDLRPLGEGLDAVAFLAHHPIWGAVAIRVNRNRFINNDKITTTIKTSVAMSWVCKNTLWQILCGQTA